jgi:hypothetical protein
MLVRELRRALGAECVYVCEFVGRGAERARTLAACRVGDRMETFDFPMADSPDAEVALHHPCIYSRGVQEIFPADHRLRDMKAEAWVGVPLSNAEGRADGLLAALWASRRRRSIRTADADHVCATRRGRARCGEAASPVVCAPAGVNVRMISAGKPIAATCPSRRTEPINARSQY